MWSPPPGSGVVAVGAAVAAPHEGLLISPASLTFELLSAKIKSEWVRAGVYIIVIGTSTRHWAVINACSLQRGSCSTRSTFKSSQVTAMGLPWHP